METPGRIDLFRIPSLASDPFPSRSAQGSFQIRLAPTSDDLPCRTSLPNHPSICLQPQFDKPADGFRGRMPSFLDRLFGFLYFIHAADYERRQIALRNLFFARLIRAEPLPYKLSLSLLRSLLILRSDIWLVE